MNRVRVLELAIIKGATEIPIKPLINLRRFNSMLCLKLLYVKDYFNLYTNQQAIRYKPL